MQSCVRATDYSMQHACLQLQGETYTLAEKANLKKLTSKFMITLYSHKIDIGSGQIYTIFFSKLPMFIKIVLGVNQNTIFSIQYFDTEASIPMVIKIQLMVLKSK